MTKEMTHQCTFRCDGCGRTEPGYANRGGSWFTPSHWYQRTDDDGTQIACSRACIELIATQSSKTGVVVPV